MAVLTAAQLSELRQRCAEGFLAGWTKAQANAALQALEDWYENTGRAAAGAAMEAAAPGVFNATQKQRLAKWWLFQKAGRE